MYFLKKIFFFSLLLTFINIQSCCFDKVPKSSISTGLDNPVSIDFTASCFAVANRGANTVNVYNFDQNKCIVSSTPVSTLTLASGINSPTTIKFSPNGKCLAVINAGSNIINFFQAQTACIFNPIAKSSVNIVDPISITFSNDAQCVAIGSSDNVVRIFAFDQILCLINSMPTTILTDRIGNPISLAYSASNTCFTVLNEALNNFNIYKINENCTLDTLNVKTIPVQPFSNNIRLAPSENAIVVSSGTTKENSTVSFYSFDSNNCSVNETATTILNSTNGINLPVDINFSPNGGCFTVANREANNVQVYAFDVDSGQIAANATVVLSATQPIKTLFSPNSKCIGVLNIVEEFTSFVNFFTFVKRSNISQAIQIKYCNGC